MPRVQRPGRAIKAPGLRSGNAPGLRSELAQDTRHHSLATDAAGADRLPDSLFGNAPGSPLQARPARTAAAHDRRRHGGGSPVGLARRHGGGSPVGLARRRGDGSPAGPARRPRVLALNLRSLDNSDSDPRSLYHSDPNLALSLRSLDYSDSYLALDLRLLDYADSSLAPSPWTPNIQDSDHGIESYPTTTAGAPATGPSANPSRGEGALEPVA